MDNCDLAAYYAAKEELNQRHFEKVLNILTPHNVKEVCVQVKQVSFHNAVTFEGLVSQIFEKALKEPLSSEMYASLCSHLAATMKVLVQSKKETSFKGVLLQKLHNEIQKQPNARSRRFCSFRLMGEMYKKKVFTEKLMHQCIYKLLYDDFGDVELEALCELMITIGEMIDQPKNKEQMNMYFTRMLAFTTNIELSPRIRFMLKGVIDLRKNKWPKISDAQPDTIASAVSVKMYLRDYLLKLAKQCTDLPESADIAEELMRVTVNISSHHVPEVNQMEDLQRYVRKRFDYIDNIVFNLEKSMRRLENYQRDKSRSRIILTTLFVLNTLVMFYFCFRFRN